MNYPERASLAIVNGCLLFFKVRFGDQFSLTFSLGSALDDQLSAFGVPEATTETYFCRNCPFQRHF